MAMHKVETMTSSEHSEGLSLQALRFDWAGAADFSHGLCLHLHCYVWSICMGIGWHNFATSDAVQYYL